MAALVVAAGIGTWTLWRHDRGRAPVAAPPSSGQIKIQVVTPPPPPPAEPGSKLDPLPYGAPEASLEEAVPGYRPAPPEYNEEEATPDDGPRNWEDAFEPPPPRWWWGRRRGEAPGYDRDNPPRWERPRRDQFAQEDEEADAYGAAPELPQFFMRWR